MNLTSRAKALSRHSLQSAISILFLLVAGCSSGGGDSTSAGTPSQPAVTPPTPGISLLAGTFGGAGTTDGLQARFNGPAGVALDGAGSAYIADAENHTIRKITASGVITLAGSPGNVGLADGVGNAARFRLPMGIAVDATGNVFVADTFNNAIRKISASGAVTTLAGNSGLAGTSDGTGNAARFNHPSGIAIDGAGNLIVADTDNATVRRISTTGNVTTIAGVPGVQGFADGPASLATFAKPVGVAIGPQGSIYVADNFGLIRKVSAANVVSTLAGSSSSPVTNRYADGIGAAADFGPLNAIVVDGSGNAFVLDQGKTAIRRVTPDGTVTTIPGGHSFYSTHTAGGIAVDSSGVIYVSESNNVISTVTPAGVVSTWQGSAAAIGTADGTGAEARFNRPTGITIDSAGTAYVIDRVGTTIRKITPAGIVTTLAGTIGPQGSSDGVGSNASFSALRDIKTAKDGAMYAVDIITHFVRKITSDGTVTTFAGRSWPDNVLYGHILNGGSSPLALAIDANGTMVVSDRQFGIRKVTTVSEAAMLACNGACFSGEVPPAMVFDAAGNLYLAESYAITRITPAGDVSVLAGNRQTAGFADGTGVSASFTGPSALAIDAVGNIYVADSGNNAVRKVTPAGVVTTIAGRSGAVGVALGSLPGSLTNPLGIAVDAKGVLLVSTENAVVKIQP